MTTNKSVIISIKPQWCELIASGKKTIEMRKTAPKIEVPFKCYMYESKGNKHTHTFVELAFDAMGHYLDFYEGKETHFDGRGEVIGEFVCDAIYEAQFVGSGGLYGLLKDARWIHDCLTHQEIMQYAGKNEIIYGWHISDLVIYDKPKELSKFYKPCAIYERGDGCGDINCPYYETPSYEYGEVMFDCEGKKPIMRPPQSWCYGLEITQKS